MPRCPYQQVLDELNILSELEEYEPTVIGTPPLGIDIPTSDIDIACTAASLKRFRRDVARHYKNRAAFSFLDLHWFADPTVRISFFVRGWEVELFCQTIPIEAQWGVRHFKVEKRLLSLRPELRNTVVDLKLSGLKTEPAFAAVLDLDGDPYEAVLKLEDYSDEELVRLTGQPM